MGNETLALNCSDLAGVMDSKMNHSDVERLPLSAGTPDSPIAGFPKLHAKSGSARRIFLASVWKLARQKYYWSPKRFIRIIWTLARNIPTQIRVLRSLSRPAYRQLIEVNPRFPFKCTAIDYLARGLTAAQRAACFIHHYRRLPDVLPEKVLMQVLLEDIVLDEIRQGDDSFTVRMGLSRPWDYEGEFSLNFEVNGEGVFVLSFTIIPGWVVQSAAQEVVLVSRLQGVKGAYDEIQRATKSMNDVAPPALLFAALCGVAEAFGIKAMAGITAPMKTEFHDCEGEAERIEQAYDEFFKELGATQGPANFYLAPMPPEEKPMTSVKQGHKIRTRKKRAFKLQITRRIYQLLREIGECQLSHSGTEKCAKRAVNANRQELDQASPSAAGSRGQGRNVS